MYWNLNVRVVAWLICGWSQWFSAETASKEGSVALLQAFTLA